MKKRGVALLFIPAGILLLALLRLPNQGPQPRVSSLQTKPVYKPQIGLVPLFVTYNLAGVNLREQSWGKWTEHQGKCDSQSEYCVSSGNGPDECEYILDLAPKFERYLRAWNNDRKELKKVFKGVRLPLVTGRGVRIGDTVRQVESKIGKPTTQSSFKSRTTYNYIYRGKRLYTSNYAFQNGRLESISFRDASAPGKYNGPNGGCP